MVVHVFQVVYSATFPEDIPINKDILAVGATDADSGSSAEIQYSLFGIGVEDFYMDANTGTALKKHFHVRAIITLTACLLCLKASCEQPP